MEDLGKCTGQCTVCTVNLWESTNNRPSIMPCNIEGCPYEDPSKQNRHFGIGDRSSTGSGLAQII